MGLLFAGCGGKKGTPVSNVIPPVEQVKIVAASGPDVEQKYTLQVQGSSGLGEEVAKSVKFRYLVGSSAVAKEPLILNEKGEITSFPMMDESVTEIEVDVQLAITDGMSGKLNASLRPANSDVKFLHTTDFLLNGTGEITTPEGYSATVEMKGVSLDIGENADSTGCDKPYPCSGSALFIFQGNNLPQIQSEDEIAEITKMEFLFNGEASEDVILTTQIKEKVKEKMGNSAVGGIIGAARDATSKIPVGDNNSAKAARAAGSTFITNEGLKSIGLFFLSGAWKSLSFVYTAGTGSAVDIGEAIVDEARDMIEEELGKQEIEVQELEGKKGKIKIICNRTMGEGKVVIEGKYTRKPNPKPDMTCWEGNYVITCTFHVDKDCKICKETPMSCKIEAPVGAERKFECMCADIGPHEHNKMLYRKNQEVGVCPPPEIDELFMIPEQEAFVFTQRGPIGSVSTTPIEGTKEVTLSSSFIDVDGKIETLSIDWGDNTIPLNLNPGLYKVDETIPYTYNKAGIYTISVTTTDNSGIKRALTTTVNIP